MNDPKFLWITYSELFEFKNLIKCWYVHLL